MQEQLTHHIDNLLKKIENDINNSKRLTDGNYKKNCVEVCQRARTAMYQIQVDLIEETKSKLQEALSLSEDDTMTRRELFETWQIVFDSMQERCKQIGGSVQMLLQNICENDIELKETYIPLLNLGSGGFLILFCLAVLNPLSLNISTCVSGIAATFLLTATVLQALKWIRRVDSTAVPTAPAEVLPSVNQLDVGKFDQKFNDLLQAFKIEENVWFSNESLKMSLKSLEQTEASLNLPKTDVIQ